MWSCAIVCMLLVGAMAQKPSTEDHKPCCAPRYFTFKQVDILNHAPDGELVVEYEQTECAYDSISKQVSIFYDAEYFNGTELRGRYIADFKEQTLYAIIEAGGETHCFPTHLNSRFPEYCIPEDAKFVQEAWIGEKDLLVDTWYFSRELGPDHEVHVAKTLGRTGCVPVNEAATYVNPTTGKLLGMLDSRTFDFDLGICDREHYFKVPEECQSGNALKTPTLEVQKLLDKISRRRKFLGQ